MQTSDRRTKTK